MMSIICFDVHNARAVLMPSCSCYMITDLFKYSNSFRHEGQIRTLMHIAATDDAEDVYDLYQHFQEACDFIGKQHICVS